MTVRPRLGRRGSRAPDRTPVSRRQHPGPNLSRIAIEGFARCPADLGISEVETRQDRRTAEKARILASRAFVSALAVRNEVSGYLERQPIARCLSSPVQPTARQQGAIHQRTARMTGKTVRNGDDLFLVLDGHRWRVIDVWQADVPKPKRVHAAERDYAGARLFLSADGDRRHERWVYYFHSRPGGYATEADDERGEEPARLATQLRASRQWESPER